MYSGLSTCAHAPQSTKEIHKVFWNKSKLFLLPAETTAPPVWKPFLEVSLSFTFPLKHFFSLKLSSFFCVCSHARGCWWRVARVSRLSQVILRSADMQMTLCLRQTSKEIKFFSGLNSRKHQKIQSDLWNYREGSERQAEWIFYSYCAPLQCSSPFHFIKSPANWHPLSQISVGLIWHFMSLLKMTETERDAHFTMGRVHRLHLFYSLAIYTSLWPQCTRIWPQF